MKKLKLLVIDSKRHTEWLTGSADDFGIAVDVVWIADILRAWDVYAPAQVYLGRLSGVISMEDPDIIVVGHNLGAWFRVVNAISREQRSGVVIIGDFVSREKIAELGIGGSYQRGVEFLDFLKERSA